MAYRTQFAQEVRKALAGRPYRQVSAKVEDGLSPAYIADMVQGRVPTEPTVRVFAEACGVDPEPLLRAAGYIEPFNAPAALLAGLAQLEAEFGRPAMFSTQDALLREATPESIERMLANLRADLEREDRERRQRGSGSPGGAMLLAAR